MKTVRNSLFETNSSSIHSLTYGMDDTLELEENIVIGLKYFDNDEYSSIDDKLALLSIALIWKYNFDYVYGYLNGYYTHLEDFGINDYTALKNFKTLLNQRGMKHVEFKWTERYGCTCDDEIMDFLYYIMKAEDPSYLIDFIEHDIVNIYDRDSDE